ncbi:MAG: YncE family protein [Sphingobacteriaceae bacterium]|nr:MAG: YncE family protein [Sphingobacteriaceae bacterium]
MKHLFIILAVTSIFASCRKEKNNPEPPTPEPTETERAGVYVLNQGSFSASNSTLTYYDYNSKVLTADIFSAANNTPLGATANDAQIYGSKMYIIVNVSSTVEVVNAKTAKLIKHIDMKDGEVNRQPRFVVFHKNKAFISSYDGTVAVLDTTTLTIDKFITVGRNPEQMAITNNKLYVANSGGLDFGNPDKTVSVIDLNTLAEITKITVVVNPVTLVADNYGDIYVISNGNYFDINPALTIIDSKTDKVKSSGDTDAAYGSPIAISGDNAYIITNDGRIKVYDVKTETVIKDNFITDGTKIKTPYSVAVDSLSERVFVTDAKNYAVNGSLLAFNKNGRRSYTKTTGINPGRIVFVNK